MDQSQASINPVCPNKPSIPYKAKPTFCPQQENSSYLNWQEQQNEKPMGSKQAFAQLTGADNLDGHCCDKVAKIVRANQKQIQEQLSTISQLNIVINEHSKLLEKSQQQLLDERKKKETESANSIDISQDLSNKDKAIEEWKQKYNKQVLENQQKDNKIQKLKEKLEEVQEQVEKSMTVTSLQDEVNTWKNRYTNLNKSNSETQEKLIKLEEELKKLKEKAPEQGDSSQTTVTTSTVRRSKLMKQDEQQQQEQQ